MNKVRYFENNILLKILQVAIVFIVLICLFGQSFVNLHFIYKHTVQIAVGFWILGLLSLVTRKTKLMFTFFYSCFFLCLFLKGTTIIPTNMKYNSQKLCFHMEHYDLSLTDDSRAQILSKFEKTNADFLMIQEVNPDLSAPIDYILHKKFPYNITINKSDLTRSYFYSKFKIYELDTFKNQNNTIILASSNLYENNENRIKFSISYSMPLFNNKSIALLDSQLQQIESGIEKDRNAIVAGNFNLESFSPKLELFKSKCGLFDCGTGYRKTSNNTSFSMFDIPYNQVYYKGGLQCNSFVPVIDKSNISYGDHCVFQFK